jgi:FKBP-type peptidyl-prolyl cis-trans isomerase
MARFLPRVIATLALLLLSAGLVSATGAASEAAEAASDSAVTIERLLEGVGEDAEVVTTTSGLSYVDIEIGVGDPPERGQVCSTHATLWLMDGTKVWSSRDPGPTGDISPFAFPLGRGRVIKGWDEGVASMSVGGIRRLAVPAELGYGEEGRPPAIPGGATLIFEVELLEIRK